MSLGVPDWQLLLCGEGRALETPGTAGSGAVWPWVASQAQVWCYADNTVHPGTCWLWPNLWLMECWERFTVAQVVRGRESGVWEAQKILNCVLTLRNKICWWSSCHGLQKITSFLDAGTVIASLCRVLFVFAFFFFVVFSDLPRCSCQFGLIMMVCKLVHFKITLLVCDVGVYFCYSFYYLLSIFLCLCIIL